MPTDKLYTSAFHLFGSALLACDYLVGLSGACVAYGWRHDSAGKAVRTLIYPVYSAPYDDKYAHANLFQLGAAAAYPVQHGDGVHLATQPLYGAS